jgi:hypothetical protein
VLAFIFVHHDLGNRGKARQLSEMKRKVEIAPRGPSAKCPSTTFKVVSEVKWAMTANKVNVDPKRLLKW